MNISVCLMGGSILVCLMGGSILTEHLYCVCMCKVEPSDMTLLGENDKIEMKRSQSSFLDIWSGNSNSINLFKNKVDQNENIGHFYHVPDQTSYQSDVQTSKSR